MKSRGRNRHSVAAIAWVLALGSCSTATAPSRPARPPVAKRLAVLEFTNADLPEDILDTLSDAVRGGAIDALAGSTVSIMTRESMKLMLKDMGIQECHEGECEVETARSIHADYVVSGRIVRMEGSYVVTLKVHDAEQAKLLGMKDVMVDTQKAMMAELREKGRRLVGETVAARVSASAAPASPPASVAPPPSPPLAVTPPPPAPEREPPRGASSGCASNQVAIPGGTFWMGSEDGDAYEKPVHKVTLSPYCIDKTEVTVAAYRACVQAGSCRPGNATVEWKDISADDRSKFSQVCTWGKSGMERHPLNCVNWNDAKSYCEWTGGRLPSEAEWEFAARGNDGRRYPWGDEEPIASRLNACGSECVSMAKQRLGNDWKAVYRANDGWAATAPVGSFPEGASPFGVLDLAGNVWEWTGDSYESYSTDAQRNPSRSRPDASPRVLRGVGWCNNDPSGVRAANRFRYDPGNRNNNLGFRCARGAKM